MAHSSPARSSPRALLLCCFTLVALPAPTWAGEQPALDAPRAEAPAAIPQGAPVSIPPKAPEGGPATLADLVPSSWTSVALFLGGAASAFVAHEGCHVVANLTLGVVPRIEPVSYMKTIPFFAISPPVSCTGAGCTKDDGSKFSPGKPGLYTIVASGLQCQQLTNELILSTEPQLLHREAPFRKGMLAFNVVLALGYAFSDWAGVEPASGDLSTMERLTGVPRGAIAAAIFVPAVLDMVRFFLPDSRWLPWAARLSKGAIFGFLFAF